MRGSDAMQRLATAVALVLSVGLVLTIVQIRINPPQPTVVAVAPTPTPTPDVVAPPPPTPMPPIEDRGDRVAELPAVPPGEPRDKTPEPVARRATTPDPAPSPVAPAPVATSTPEPTPAPPQRAPQAPTASATPLPSPEAVPEATPTLTPATPVPTVAPVSTPVRTPRPTPTPVSLPTPPPAPPPAPPVEPAPVVVASPEPVPVVPAVSALSVGPAASCPTIWSGDAETGDLSQWVSAVDVAPDRIQTVTSPVRQGTYAYRFEVRQGDNPVPAYSGNDRAELGQANPGEGPLIHEGDENWTELSIMFDESFPNASWQVVAQWKQVGSNPPPAELNANNDVLTFEMGPGLGSNRTKLFSTPIERGAWHDIVMHAKWSPDPNVGFVELWHNGVQVVPKTMTTNMVPGIPNHARIGYYRDVAVGPTGVVFIDGYRVSSVPCA